jgi:hypothetical protein
VYLEFWAIAGDPRYPGYWTSTVVILYETMFEMNHKKQSGVIFKIDFKKAYNKIKWSSMKQTL